MNLCEVFWLIPHVILIIFYLILFEEAAKFILEIFLTVMRVLIGYVGCNSIYSFWIYRKSPIAILPVKIFIAFSFCLDPF